jgi:hemerythrin superfamily protein
MDLDSALTGKPAEGATATDILRADHNEVRRLFSEYERAASDAHAGAAVAQSLSMQLELHDTIEREIFYPALREFDSEFVDRALGAHDEIAVLAERVRMHADSGDLLKETVAELRALVESHVREEEQVFFRCVEERAAAELRDLGRRLVERKEELTRSTASFEGPAT